MSAVQPGGLLFRLPREVRDKIYGYYFNRCYLVFWYHQYDNKDDPTLADLAILRVSKSINFDAKHFLFSKAASVATTFKYKIDYLLEFSAPPCKEATERMTNVEFDVLVDHGGYWDVRGYMKPSCEATIDHFTGTSVVRDSLRIRCHATSDLYLRAFMKTRFFCLLKELNGFRKITMVLEWVSHYHIGGEKLKVQKVVRDILCELEPHLGPFITKSPVHYDLKSPPEEHFHMEMEFHPLKFHIKKLRAEATRLIEEADRPEKCDL